MLGVMTLALGAVELGLIYAIMSMGVFVSFRILDIPDLTIDGSFILGCAVSAILTYHGHPILGIVLSILAGALAGMVTGFLQTKLKVQVILAGILTMTALYSINLHVMGNKPNVTLLNVDTIFTFLEDKLPQNSYRLPVITVILLLVCSILFWFLKTQIGMSLRATGDNEDMVRASSINSEAMKIMGLAIANAFVALSGAVLAQYQSFSDANGGTGTMVIGLASVIVGEAIFGRRSMLMCFISVVLGSVLYRALLTIALQIGLPSSDLKLLSAILVIIAISVPVVKNALSRLATRR